MSHGPVRLIRALLACALLACPAVAVRAHAQQVVDGFRVTDAQCAALPELDRKLQAIDACKKGATAKPRAIKSCMTWWKGWPAACMAPPTCTAQVDTYYAHLTGAMAFADRTKIFKTAGLANAVNGQIRNSCAARKLAAATPEKPAFKTGLGDDIDELVAKSPTLLANLRKIGADKIRYGTSGGGTYWDPTAKEMVIDPDNKTNTKWMLGLLAHESGHAFYKRTDPYRRGMKREEFIKRYTNDSLRNEGAATLMNVKVFEEMKAAGVDIDIVSSREANKSKYREIAKKYPKNPARARNEIAEIFRHNEFPSGAHNAGKDYEKMYNEQAAYQYDKKYGRKKR